MPVYDPYIDVTAIAGQSNALGATPFAGTSYSGSYPKVFISRVDGFVEPINIGTNNRASSASNIGLECAVIEKFSAGSDRVAIAKQARGGTNINSDWIAPADGITLQNGGPELVKFCRHVDRVLKNLSELGFSPDLKRILWWQGLGDSTGGQANNYESNLTNLIAFFRYYFSKPLLTIHLVQSFCEDPASRNDGAYTNLATVQAAQAAVAAADANVTIYEATVNGYVEATPNGIHPDGTTMDDVAVGLAAQIS